MSRAVDLVAPDPTADFASDGDRSGAANPDSSAARTQGGKLLQGAAVITLLRGASIVGMAAINVILARTLPQDDFGVFILLSSLVAFGSIVAMGGLNRSLLRFIAESLGSNDHAAALQTVRRGLLYGSVWILATGMVGWTLLFFCGPLWRLPDIAWLGPLTAIWLGLLAWHNLIGETLRGFHRNFQATCLAGLNGGPLFNVVFIGGFALAAAIWPSTLRMVLIVNVLALLALMPVALFWLGKTMRNSELQLDARATSETPTSVGEKLRWKVLFATSFALMLAQALYFIAGQSDIWIAGATLTHDDVALFGAARRIATLLSLPLQLGTLAVISTIASMYKQQEYARLETILKHTGMICFLLAMVPMIAIACAPGRILELFFGAEYRDAATILVLLSLGQLVLAWSGTQGTVLMMTGHQTQLLQLTWVSCAALLLGGFAAATFFGSNGLALVSAAVLAGQSVAAVLLTKKLTGMWSCAGW